MNYQILELTAKETLTHITGWEDTFLDFADAQPGDPLLDIAVLTLWDQKLTDFFLEGYSGIKNNEETQQLLSLYRLVRHLAEIPWLLEREFKELAARNIMAITYLTSPI